MKVRLSCRLHLVIAVFSTLCLSQLAQQQVSAASTSSAEIVKEIEKSEILDKDYKVSATVDARDQEAYIYTYANSASKDKATDCKIDAVLIAKKVVEVAPEILKVRVRFYEPTKESYREVVVKKVEVAAFASGSVTKDDLLASLDVVGPISTGKIKASKTPSSTNSALPTPAATTSCDLNGLQFSYPKSWTFRDKQGWGDFAEIFRFGKSWCSIVFRKSDKLSPQEAADDEIKYYWETHQHRMVRQPSTITFGANKRLQGLVYYIKDESNSENRYENHIFFGTAHKVYRITALFCPDDYKLVEPDLQSILDTVVVK